MSAIIHVDATRIYIDGHVNKGFSGGPVISIVEKGQESKARIAGIVSKSPRPLLVPVVDESWTPLTDDNGEASAYFPESQGFLIAFGINHANDLIDQNPIGFELNPDVEPI